MYGLYDVNQMSKAYVMLAHIHNAHITNEPVARTSTHIPSQTKERQKKKNLPAIPFSPSVNSD